MLEIPCNQCINAQKTFRMLPHGVSYIQYCGNFEKKWRRHSQGSCCSFYIAKNILALILAFMMTSWHIKTFHVFGSLWWEFPSQRVSDTKLRCFVCCLGWTSCWKTTDLPAIWVAMTLMWRQYNEYNERGRIYTVRSEQSLSYFWTSIH